MTRCKKQKKKPPEWMAFYMSWCKSFQFDAVLDDVVASFRDECL